jgi:hypothetical protein
MKYILLSMKRYVLSYVKLFGDLEIQMLHANLEINISKHCT